jgi:hypothetical protein
MNLQESIRADLNKLSEATQSTSVEEMIDGLNKMFPCCKAVSTEEFDGRKGGIWFRGSDDCEIEVEYDGEKYSMPLYEPEVFTDTFGINPELDEFLDNRGWYGEPYDSGTLMAYPS